MTLGVFPLGTKPLGLYVGTATASGPTASGSLTTADSTVTASASVSPVASASVTTAAATFSGSASVPSEVSGALNTAAATVSASAYVSPIVTASMTTGADTFSGSASSGGSIASGSLATSDSTITSSAFVSPVATLSITTAEAVFSGSAQGQVSGVYPDPATVLAGVAYGPSGSDYTGTLVYATAAEIAAEVLSSLQATTIPVDAKKMNGALIAGDGTSGNLWRGA